MAGKTKMLLGAAVLFLSAGLLIELFMDVGRFPFLHVVFPVGAIFLGMFLLSRLFAKEDSVYGDDQKKAMADVGKGVKTPPADHT